MAPPPQFETWMAREDSSNATPGNNPDIWYRVGLFTQGGLPPFVYTMPAAIRVPYNAPPPPALSSEYNPELWNKNDAMWIFPFRTHLVFDMTSPLPLGFQEVEYIDP